MEGDEKRVCEKQFQRLVANILYGLFTNELSRKECEKQPHELAHFHKCALSFLGGRVARWSAPFLLPGWVTR